MEKEANFLKYGLATKPLLVRIDRSAYAPQMRRIADLQSWLVSPGVLYIPAYREGGSKCQPPIYADIEPLSAIRRRRETRMAVNLMLSLAIH